MFSELTPYAVLASKDNRMAMALCGLSLANYVLVFLVNLVLARNLTFVAFEDYNVGISSLMILSVLASLGLDKFAHKCLPAYRERSDWGRSHGFMGFATRLTAVVGILLALIFDTSLEALLISQDSRPHVAILVGVGFVTVIALSQLFVEFASTYRGQLPAVAIYRLLTPLVILIANGLWISSTWAYSGTSAAVCYGTGWFVSLVCLVVLLRRIAPREVWQAKPITESRPWLAAGLPLLVYGLLMTVHTQAGVIILKLLYPVQPMVSRYAVALQIGSFIAIVATSTNRFYLPKLSALMERGDTAGMRRAGRRRMTLIGGMALAFLAVIVLMGRSILAHFGQDYVPAFPSLVVIAVGATLSTLYSIAPFYLHFAGQGRVASTWTALSVVAGIALTAVLSKQLGELGAAIGYALPLSVMFIGMRLHALRFMRPNRTAPD